jgi:enterochelin esterase-like enzyme
MSKPFQSLLSPLQKLFPSFKKRTSFSPQIISVQDFASQKLKREVRLDVFLPPGYAKHPYQYYPLLIFNDGQDLEAINLKQALERLYRQKRLQPIIAVGVFAGDRMQEYGTAQYPDYKKRGKRAKAYTQFLLKELLPYLKEEFRITEDRAIAGFSLGGLSAFDIAWHHSDIFSKVGVFSGSLWWRSQAFDPKDPDGHRIAHDMVRENKMREGLQFWFQTGTLDEEEDRNNNGIIDSIDDTRDLISELCALGYQEGKDIHYVEMIGGRHDYATWGKIMPEFLVWTFGN